MMLGATINGKHTYDDYGLFLTDKIAVSSPEPKLQQIDIPGADGTIDLTDAVTGAVNYANRTITMQFATKTKHHEQLRTQLLNDLHGKRVQIVLDEDPEYYYTGRAVVDLSECNRSSARVTITATVQPYKLRREETVIEMSLSAADLSTNYLEPLNGNAVDSLGWDTDLVFGTPDAPLLDLTIFESLVFSWGDPYMVFGDGDVTATIFDADGNSWTTALIEEGETQTSKSFSFANLISHGIDPTQIRRIFVKNVGGCAIGAMSSYIIVKTIQNGAMRVVPTWYGSSVFAISVGGVYDDLPGGNHKNPDIVLRPGDNRILIKEIGTTAARTLGIRFRAGDL